MARIYRRAVLWAVALVLVGSLPAMAIPVISPWGSDTFAKAIHFTGSAKPVESSNGAVLNLYRGSGGTLDSGIIMSPVGDGSYVCTAAVYPGASYTYYFGFRNRLWDADTYAKWLTNTTGGERDQDVNRARTITIPSGVQHGYYIYNAFGDQTVLGFQAPNGDTSVLSTLNPYLAQIGGSAGDTPGMTRLATEGGDTRFANMSGSNAYGLSVLQTGDSQFTVSWSFSIGGSEAYVPSVHGAQQFGGVGASSQVTNGYTSKNYGFRIWRATLPGGVGAFTSVAFTDITSSINGDTNWADNDNNAFNGASFTDTSISSLSDTRFLYLVTYYNAYGHLQNDTSRQNFSGGYETGTRAGAIRVFFIVEDMNENVVFPNGETAGRVYLTPYIDGVRHPEYRMPASVVRVERRSLS